MEKKDQQPSTEKISYNTYPKESNKEPDLNQSEHLKQAKNKEHETEVVSEKESYNTLPDRRAEQ